MRTTNARKEKPEPAHVTRARAQAKIMSERDALRAAGDKSPIVTLASRYSVWPTTIQRWLDQTRWPTLPQSLRILDVEVKP